MNVFHSSRVTRSSIQMFCLACRPQAGQAIRSSLSSIRPVIPGSAVSLSRSTSPILTPCVVRIGDVLRERETAEPGITGRIEDKLDLIAWPAWGRQARQNIWIEDLVTRDEWNTFIDAVRDCADEPEAIQATVSTIMSDLKLKGRRASCATATIFGR